MLVAGTPTATSCTQVRSRLAAWVSKLVWRPEPATVRLTPAAIRHAIRAMAVVRRARPAIMSYGGGTPGVPRTLRPARRGAATPGAVEVTGEWTPGRDLRGPLNAVVRTREALVYDWVPLLIGSNTGLYGVMDAELRVAGSIHTLNFEGSGRLRDLHRWEQIPPHDPMPWTINFRGQLDRDQERVVLETVETLFSGSHVHISGAIDHFTSSPELDLVVALERSRLEDLAALAGRLWTLKGGFGIRGRVDGMLAIQGTWAQRRYGGFLGREMSCSALAPQISLFPKSRYESIIAGHGSPRCILLLRRGWPLKPRAHSNEERNLCVTS